jgi:hypothetical protein
VDWAILSDHYGVFLPSEKHAYYEKAPATVTTEEEAEIIRQFEQKLSSFKEILFYIRAETFHPFYERVLLGSSLSPRITLFQDLNEIIGVVK